MQSLCNYWINEECTDHQKGQLLYVEEVHYSMHSMLLLRWWTCDTVRRWGQSLVFTSCTKTASICTSTHIYDALVCATCFFCVPLVLNLLFSSHFWTWMSTKRKKYVFAEASLTYDQFIFIIWLWSAVALSVNIAVLSFLLQLIHHIKWSCQPTMMPTVHDTYCLTSISSTIALMISFSGYVDVHLL